VGRKHIARLMPDRWYRGGQPPREHAEDDRSIRLEDTRPAPDLVARDFGTPGRTDRGSPTSRTSNLGRVSLPRDRPRRMPVGGYRVGGCENHLRTELVLDAPNIAVAQRRPTPV